MHRNLTRALVDGLRHLLARGETVTSRGAETRELRAHVIRIERPTERVLVLPGRGNNIFAALAETLWVIGGRDDIAYLKPYLPRAADFSDDGHTWRGAYGPRLRDWHGTDQIHEIARLLNADPDTRRAALIIFDPARDFTTSRDIPCNNWLHFLIRDGHLHLTVALRSNDAIWGFSGINAFEWSVLQQMMAHWTGTQVGTMTFTIASFHLYAHHYQRAEEILARVPSRTLYDFGFTTPEFTTPITDLAPALRRFFELEAALYPPTPAIAARIAKEPDPFLRATLQMLHVHALYQSGAPATDIDQALAALPTSDLRIGAIDYLTRQKRLRDRSWLTLRPEEHTFFAQHWSATEPTSLADVYRVLQTLHEKKTRSYGDSWKKHGELLGVFANITRKYDRIEAVLDGAKATADEGLIHTLADLAVYAGKYLTWLAEHQPAAFAQFLAPHPQAEPITRYHHNQGFDPIVALLLTASPDRPTDSLRDLTPLLATVRTHYRALEAILTSPDPHRDPHTKCQAAAALSLAAATAIELQARTTPAAYAAFAEEVELL